MKHDILEKLAETMYSFKAYPEDDDSAVLQKHWLASTHALLSQVLSQYGMAGRTALSLRWSPIAQSFENLDVRM